MESVGKNEQEEDNNIDKLYQFVKFELPTGRGLTETKTYIGIIVNADKCKIPPNPPDEYCFTILAEDGDILELKQTEILNFKAYNINTDLLKNINGTKKENKKTFNTIIKKMKNLTGTIKQKEPRIETKIKYIREHF